MRSPGRGSSTNDSREVPTCDDAHKATPETPRKMEICGPKNRRFLSEVVGRDPATSRGETSEVFSQTRGTSEALKLLWWISRFV